MLVLFRGDYFERKEGNIKGNERENRMDRKGGYGMDFASIEVKSHDTVMVPKDQSSRAKKEREREMGV